MKHLPSDPNAFRSHVITALCDDIEGGRGFVRVEAIRAVMGASLRDRALVNSKPAAFRPSGFDPIAQGEE
jgi:hypothetical protein